MTKDTLPSPVTLSTPDIEKLRELAMKAAPGPWINGYWSGQCHVDHKHGSGKCVYDYTLHADDGEHYGCHVVSAVKQVEICGSSDYGPIASREDAAFIAAANPQTILALLDALPSPVSVPAAVIRAVVCAHEQFASVADYAALTVECARCSGAGYHHGFGELGHDPDWCTECGGVGSALNEAAYDAAEIAFITQSLAQAPFPVSVPEGDARVRAQDLAQSALRNFPHGTVTWDRIAEFINAVEPALLSARREGIEKAAAWHDQRVEWETARDNPLAANFHREAAAAIRSLSSPEEG